MRCLLVAAAAAAAAQGSDVRVNVDPGRPMSPPVLPNFVGFSIEVSGVLGMIGDKGDNAAFAELLAILHDTTPGAHAGPTLRLGGNSADNSCFTPNPGVTPPPIENCYCFGPQALEAYRRFAEATAAAANISYVIDTNFGASPDPQRVAVPHIRGIGVAGLWPFVSRVEIGNEMDLYFHQKKSAPMLHRNASYDFGDYDVEFGSFESAYIAAGMPRGMLQGGTWAGRYWYPHTRQYIERYHTGLNTMSLHKYPRSTCDGSTVTREQQLAYSATAGAWKSIGEVIANVSDLGVPVLIGEGNSASCGGAKGVSDTFTSALWVVDFLPAGSKEGIMQMNFHGGPKGVYPAIAFPNASADIPDVRPLFYGLLAFSELVANHSRWVPSRVSGLANVSGDPTCATGIPGGKRGSGVCCLKSCGVCGGTGCNSLPGNSSGCCGGDISRAGRSCTTHLPPCVPDPDWAPAVSAHAAVDDAGRVKVLLVAKGSAATLPRQIDVCIAGAEDKREATAVRLEAGGDLTKTDGIRWAGQTWDGSSDGRPTTGRSAESVDTGSAPGCFTINLEPQSAALLTVQ